MRRQSWIEVEGYISDFRTMSSANDARPQTDGRVPLITISHTANRGIRQFCLQLRIAVNHLRREIVIPP
jgi:hypothetical protein